MDTNDPFSAPHMAPTAARPLLGLTILVVEDSRYACEAMRLLCLRSGARIRRADCIRSARRHLQVYRPSIVVVDMGLPDGNGADLIAEIANAEIEKSVVLATSGNDILEAEAMAAGAQGFLSKPITSLAVFQQLVLAALPIDRHPPGLRSMVDELVSPDELAYHDDINYVADILDNLPNDQALDYVAQFLQGVARSVADARMEQAALALAEKRSAGATATSETAQIAGLIQQRLSQKIAI
ncbi:DNA-binding NarL/FixJ family response regulator [Sulfitobacter undariae]|uniref:DNA-binding NarL/FixJ family response regulator n=1 Tax=Sulfitobacter undariae TaxID=1563671 RepID=A0A7W6E1M1_9RHOB|nr:response regulator [Sulfitobacter undariae]MBB3993068.1 DNA-binding NarL/FixJ family response regulator [Sulfitobacter undariae]